MQNNCPLHPKTIKEKALPEGHTTLEANFQFGAGGLFGASKHRWGGARGGENNATLETGVEHMSIILAFREPPFQGSLISILSSKQVKAT